MMIRNAENGRQNLFFTASKDRDTASGCITDADKAAASVDIATVRHLPEPQPEDQEPRGEQDHILPDVHTQPDDHTLPEGHTLLDDHSPPDDHTVSTTNTAVS